MCFWFFILLLTIVGLNHDQKMRQFMNIADLNAILWIHFCTKTKPFDEVFIPVHL